MRFLFFFLKKKGFFLFYVEAAAEVLWDTVKQAVCNMAILYPVQFFFLIDCEIYF